MASDWLNFSLGEILDITSSKRIFRSDYCESGVPFYRSKEIIEKSKGNNISTELFISEDKFEAIKNKFGAPEPGDILLTSVGTLGVPYLVKNEDHFYFKDGNLTWFRNFSDQIMPKYLHLWFTSALAKRQIDEITIGSTQQALTISSLKSLMLKVPPLSQQKAISHILGSLDDKIELNRQMNETLEAMAQALFKSWFVDFDPVIDNALAAGNAIPDEFSERAEQRKAIEKKNNSDIQNLFPDEFEFTEEMGWIPKGWKLINFGEFCDIKKGKNITKSTVAEGSVPVVAGGLNPAYYHNKSNVEGPVITVSASGANAGFINLYYQDIWASDCSYVNESMSPFIFTTYSFLKYYQDKVFGLQHGAVQPHVYPKDLSRLNFIDSNEGVKIAIEKNLVSYYKKVKFNEELIETLTKLRDTLLPKLMSGEVRVADATTILEDI